MDDINKILEILDEHQYLIIANKKANLLLTKPKTALTKSTIIIYTPDKCVLNSDGYAVADDI